MPGAGRAGQAERVRTVWQRLAILLGRGAPPRVRFFRALAALCFGGALALLALAVFTAVEQANTPHKKPLPVGTIFSAALTPQPIAATATPQPATPSPSEAATSAETATPEPSPSPSPSPTPPPDESPLARLIIPTIHVDAPITLRGVDPDGTMQDPNGPDDVAYYTFSGRPGFGPGNNAVFAGHVDYYPHRTAVFWNLDKLRPGDVIEVALQDGTTYIYRVTDAVVYPATSAPVAQIVGPTPQETVTLITCNGTFSGGHYNNRLVVRAERTDQPPVQAAEPGRS